MVIRDDDLFKAISLFTVLQWTGLESRGIPSIGRLACWAALAGMTQMLFVSLPLIAIPPATLFQYLKGLLF